VHGDAHPENIIKMGKRKIAVIDFTDLCLTDFTRDLGTFLQQLEYMCGRKIADKKYAEKVKKLFLEEYFKYVKDVENDLDVEERIETYYYWTAMRTATHFLMKSGPEPTRAEPILKQISDKFNIKLC
jgi:thiamine kinase-like enzyme